MKKTIYVKFLIAYALFAVFGFLVVATIVQNMMFEHCRRNRAESLYREATEIANTYAADLYNSETSLQSVQKELTALSNYMQAIIRIINPSGRLVVDSSVVLDVNQETVIEGFDPTVTAGTYYTTGTFFDTFEEEMLTVFAPITANYKVNAYVVIHSPMTALQREAEELLNIAYIMLIILFLLSLIILIFFTELVYVPIRRITTATEQYAAGNMDYPLVVESEDEMGYLAASLSYMAMQIAGAEEDQKKFIANVSHDFRSPLTSINGYLTAMLDGTIPPEMHEKYLHIVQNETERLTKLTNGLLSLNNLSSRGMILEKTDFDINRTIRETAASFEGTCREKGLKIDLVLTEHIMLVHADMAKIQQVLYNLLDNAIKFSHKGGVVKIETTERGAKVFVSVKDNGIGIPKEDQKYIYDRFYKSDASRGKDRKGTGLGLAIVREIVKAHDENINLISTEGEGSEFIFSVPKAEVMEETGD
ncbi:MAG: HAMP domain-containing protein [Lachnospiraceae bacterium]|nr:HAMP domain-containing protein [Lachnospiraceae bacterium]